MDCPYVPELGYGDFGKQLLAKIGNQRIPISGSIELTFRCNLRCQHCYLDSVHDGIDGQQELTTQEWYDIFDQLADAGTLWLLLTGGEPLVRPDFLDIYTYAKRKGFLVTVFTNGTTLTPEIVEYWAEWRPQMVEISLYGRTRETYERVTQIPGSYDRCMHGIELLLEHNIPLKLKSPVMTLNKSELWDMQTYAKDLGLGFRYDPLINAGVGNDDTITHFRLSPEEIVELDLADDKRHQAWLNHCQRYQDAKLDLPYIYACTAGTRSYHIDPYGKLGICLMSRYREYDLRSGTFKDGWENFLPQVSYQRPSTKYTCNTCQLRALCDQCPGWADMESGNLEQKVDFLCELAHLRGEAFNFPRPNNKGG